MSDLVKRLRHAGNFEWANPELHLEAADEIESLCRERSTEADAMQAKKLLESHGYLVWHPSCDPDGEDALQNKVLLGLNALMVRYPNDIAFANAGFTIGVVRCVVEATLRDF